MSETAMTNESMTYYPQASSRRQLMDIKQEFEEMQMDSDFPLATIKVPGHEARPLTTELANVLIQVADQLSRGKAVLVAPRDTHLTTQEAADMLGMSRPTFVKLLETGKIPFKKVGRHRRVQLQDVEHYSRARHNKMMRKMENLAAETDIFETVDNPLIRE